MNCDRNTQFNKETLEALMKLPAFRYMKAPVDTVAQLYEKYPDGNERGTFAFVFNEGTFYAYKPSTMTAAAQWISTASADIVDVANQARAAAEEARIAAENANAAIEEIDGTYAKKNEVVFAKDVVDNLASSHAAKVLSANQGRVLNERKQDAKPNSTTPLINGLGRIDDIYVPEYMKGNNLFKGVIDDNAGSIASGDAAYNGLAIGDLNVADVPAGHYFIIGAGVLVKLGGFTATSGDWIISNQTQGWARIGDSAVAGVKGDAEANYRTGLVSLSLAEIAGQDVADELEHLGRDLVNTYTGDGVLHVNNDRWEIANSTYALKTDIQKVFTFVVDSQDKCNAWANGIGYDFSSVLVKPGNYIIPDIGIMLNASLYVKAMPGAYFTYKGSGSAFYFDEDVTSDRAEYLQNSYEGLQVGITGKSVGAGSFKSKGFYLCFNLRNCIVTYSWSTGLGDPSYEVIPFDRCVNLHKCHSDFGGLARTGEGTIQNFSNCTNLYDCTVAVGNVLTGFYYGFRNCTYLTNCYVQYGGGGVESGGMYSDCTYLTNCKGVVARNDATEMRVFVGCTRLLQCHAVHKTNSPESICFRTCSVMQNCLAEHTVQSLKYVLCYASATGTSYPVADTPNGGFNS